MEFPIKKATGGPEKICDIDDRVRVDPMTSPPYNWICFLLIEGHDERKWKGSGFKICIPDVNCMVVVTCGHCTYTNGAYAKQISVQFPGQEPVTVVTKDLYASPEYVKNQDEDHDYGLILLPGNSDVGFSWSGIVPDDEIKKSVLTNCGYPGDKPRATLWKTSRPAHDCSVKRIYYKNATIDGQSGCPVYACYQGYWTVVGIHSYGRDSTNSAVRFVPEMVLRFYERMNAISPVSIRSYAFPNVYLRCDGSGVAKFKWSGGGRVNCQYKPPQDWEKYIIYPVAMNPSLAELSTYPVHILSAEWENVYIRLDVSGMKCPKAAGSGVVNCQFGSYEWERYNLRKEPNGTFSFQSFQFPHCFIRLDGTGVSKYTNSGGGVVNCQYYADPSQPVQDWERFYIEKLVC